MRDTNTLLESSREKSHNCFASATYRLSTHYCSEFIRISPNLLMPHLSDDIPWYLLASNLHWAPGRLAWEIRVLNLPQLPGKLKDKDGCVCGVTNLHPTFPKTESSDQDEFSQAFAHAVKEHSKRKRAEYPEKYSPPTPSDVLLGDELVETIESHLSKRMKGGPRLPSEQRTAFAFLHPWDIDDHCNFWSSNKIGFLNLEVVKILLMLGELDPILQACAHPDVGLAGWYSAAVCDCNVSTVPIRLFQTTSLNFIAGESLCSRVGYGPGKCSVSLHRTQHRTLFPAYL